MARAKIECGLPWTVIVFRGRFCSLYPI